MEGTATNERTKFSSVPGGTLEETAFTKLELLLHHEELWVDIIQNCDMTMEFRCLATRLITGDSLVLEAYYSNP